jgi:hypothetical protein
MKKIFIFFIITINLYSIELLFKDDVINCENFQDKKLFCSWGIGKNLDDAKDNFNQNTRIKFDYIFSKNRIRIYDSMTFQRLSRVEKDLYKFYSCKDGSFIKKEGYIFYKKYCDVIEFKPKEVQINPNQANANRQIKLLRTEGFDALQKEIIKELAKEHKEKMKKEKELEQKLFEEYKKEYYKNKGKQ